MITEKNYQVEILRISDATIGRNGNRIENASFVLNGKMIQLTPNENGNNLHSGPDGFEFMMWEAENKRTGGCFPSSQPGW